MSAFYHRENDKESGKDKAVRFVTKGGRYNIKSVGISGRRKQFMYDFFTTLVDTKWRWSILIFVGGFVLTWLLFGLYYWLITKFHGDIAYVSQEQVPCIANVYSFSSAYLFSIETQTTIGYGFRYVTEECPYAYIGVLLQNIVGAGLQAALAGLVVAKVRRGKKRSGTIVFSSVACIVEEDEQYKLIFRIGDMRKSHIIGVHVRGHLFKKVQSDPGNTVPVRCFPMDFKGEDGSPQIFLARPTQLVHVIDQKSPFWKMSRDDLIQESFELVMILDGTVATTSQPFQAQTSYLSSDILWGRRFDTLGKFNKQDCYVINFSNFHRTHPVPMSDCSAYQVYSFRKSGYTILKDPSENSDSNHFRLIKHRANSSKNPFSPRRINQYRENKNYLSVHRISY